MSAILSIAIGLAMGSVGVTTLEKCLPCQLKKQQDTEGNFPCLLFVSSSTSFTTQTKAHPFMDSSIFNCNGSGMQIR